MTQANPLAAYAGGMNLAREQKQAERKNVLQQAGIISAAARNIQTPEQFEAAKAQLVGMGAIDGEAAGQYTFEQMPQLHDMVRGVEGQLDDERDMRDYQTGVAQWEREFEANRTDAKQKQTNWDAKTWLEQQNANKPKPPADEYGRYAQEEKAAGRTPLSRIDFAQAKKGQETIYGPDGKPILVRGGKQATEKPLTEAQSKSVIYTTRARNALKNLEGRDQELTSVFGHIAGKFGAAGNMAQSAEYQQAKQAADEFLAAILRKDTGAAITNQEFELYGPMFLPAVGDGPEVLEQKRIARQNAIAALEAGMTDGEVDKVKSATGQTGGPAQSGGIQALSDDELRALAGGQ